MMVHELCSLLVELSRGWLWVPISPPELTAWELAVLALDRWQTLIAGMLAALGAGATIWVLLYQAKEEKRRREKAARIRVPHALSPLTSYLNFCFETWLEPSSRQKFPDLPNAEIEVLMQVAPDIDEDTFETISEVVISTQSFADRAKSFTAAGRSPVTRARAILIADIAYLLFLTNSLYAYGRLEAKSIPLCKPTRTELLGALPMIPRDLDEDARSKLEKEIIQAIERRLNPLGA